MRVGTEVVCVRWDIEWGVRYILVGECCLYYSLSASPRPGDVCDSTNIWHESIDKRGSHHEEEGVCACSQLPLSSPINSLTVRASIDE